MSKNHLPGNPYAGHAEEDECQPCATLALAFEQRTASLIALHTQEFPESAIANWVEVRNQIIARLGLGGGDD